MRLTIGRESVEAKIVSEGTIISDKSEATLRKLTLSFSIIGMNASERYKTSLLKAKESGVVSGDSNQQEQVFWDVYDLGATWQQQGEEPLRYEVLWELTERE